MKNTWAQPSLSRDFAVLSASILFILAAVSVWVTYTTYARHTDAIIYDLEKEAVRIEYRLDAEIERANYILNAMGHHILRSKDTSLLGIAQMLKSFDNKGGIYSIFTWVGPDQTVLASSNRGILEKPVDMSDRDYVSKALAEPWKMQLGKPIQGRISERWVIPVALGLSDDTGKALGMIVIGLDINTLSDQISQLVRREGISFAIVSKNLTPLTQVSPDNNFVSNNFSPEKLIGIDFTSSSSGLISKGNLFFGTGSYLYYRVSANYPYVALLGYDAEFSDEQVRSVLWSRLIEIMGIAVFLFVLMWIVRVRVIRPVLEMTDVLADVASGSQNILIPNAGAEEINGLGKQIQRVHRYIAENIRIIAELRHKMAVMRQSKQQADIRVRSKSEYLAYICQELKQPLSYILTGAQALKDQLYGPIENRKYQQYAAEIVESGNKMLANIQDAMTIGKLDAQFISLTLQPLDVSAALHKSLRFLADKISALGITSHVSAPPSLPQLMGDDFRLQQLFSNTLLALLERQDAVSALSITAQLSSANKEQAILIISFSRQDSFVIRNEEIEEFSQRLLKRFAPASPASLLENSATFEPPHIGIELVKILMELHEGVLIEQNATIVLLFPASRLRYTDEDQV